MTISLENLTLRKQRALGSVEDLDWSSDGESWEPVRNSPVRLGSSVLVTGWIADPLAQAPGRVLFLVSDAHVCIDRTEGYGLDRSDVAGFYGDPDMSATGFSFEIPADFLTPGSQRFQIGIISADGSGYFTLPVPVDVTITAVDPSPTTEIRYSSSHVVHLEDEPIPDIDQDQHFIEFFARARPYTMTHKEAMFALYQAARYVAQRGIPGDFVECGVWKGGSSLLAGLALRSFDPPETKRKLWLYDSFQGMSDPTDVDVDLHGVAASEYIKEYADDGKWVYAPIDEVREIFRTNGFSDDQLRFVEGDVSQTLQQELPETISLLRLDTDWYESTKAELNVLFPRLAVGGVLIIDDYGHWAGARQAVDEYFSERHPMLLHRVDYSVRIGVKTHSS